MIMLQFRFTGIGFKKGVLFSEYKNYPMLAIEFLGVVVFWIPDSTGWLFMNALNGLAQDRNWSIENCHSIRLAKKKAQSKARAQAKASMRDRLDNYRQQCDELSVSHSKLIRENRHLKEAIKIVGEAK